MNGLKLNEKWRKLLLSRRFWFALISLATIVFGLDIPEDKVAEAITWIAIGLIGSYGLQDGLALLGKGIEALAQALQEANNVPVHTMKGEGSHEREAE